MRKLPWIIVVIASGAGVASASPCAWSRDDYRVDRPASAYDVGFVWARFDIDALSQPVTAKIVRFETRAWFRRHLYVGGEVDFGQLSANANGPEDIVARSESATTDATLHGTLGAAKLVLGAGTSAGAFSGGAELAGGVRYTTFTTQSNDSGSGMLDTAFVIEGRGRLDLQVTRTVSIGAVAGVDLHDRHAVTAGLLVGLHFPR